MESRIGIRWWGKFKAGKNEQPCRFCAQQFKEHEPVVKHCNGIWTAHPACFVDPLCYTESEAAEFLIKFEVMEFQCDSKE